MQIIAGRQAREFEQYTTDGVRQIDISVCVCAPRFYRGLQEKITPRVLIGKCIGIFRQDALELWRSPT